MTEVTGDAFLKMLSPLSIDTTVSISELMSCTVALGTVSPACATARIDASAAWNLLCPELPGIAASIVCTVELTEHKKGYRLKLSDLHEHLFGEDFKEAHDARADADALARCYVALLKADV